jgi:hypothetical protein
MTEKWLMKLTCFNNSSAAADEEYDIQHYMTGQRKEKLSPTPQ